MIHTIPKVTKTQWSVIANTIMQSRQIKNNIAITYFDGVKRKATGKVIDVDNFDQQLTVKNGDDYLVLHYRHILEAAVLVS